MATPKMTQKQFMDALKRHGMRWTGFMGYVELGDPKHTSTSVLNVGKHAGFRAWLAYLVNQHERALDK